ncbi:unnamed protein product, partial [Symbiodinium necroappetens]
EHKAEEGQDAVASAIMTHLFVEARRQWDAVSSAPPPSALPSPPLPPPVSPGQSSAHVPDRPPKTFSAWNQQVKAYEDRLLDGKRRTFPVQELLGAEEILARMWFEHTVSKMYTPVTLGEIVSRRTWTPGRVLNPLAANRASAAASSKALRFDHGALVQEEPAEWSPKGLFSTIDGANAARWAWTLLGIGEEDDVMKYADWFVAKARAHSEMVPAIQAFWHKTAWTLAMALRNSTSFGEATKHIRWQEVILTQAPPPRRQPQIATAAAPADTTEENEDQDPTWWGMGGGRKRRRGGKARGKGRGGKDKQQQSDRGGDGKNAAYQGWWSQKDGGKKANQDWWGQPAGGGKQQHYDDQTRPWRAQVPDPPPPKKIRLSSRTPRGDEVIVLSAFDGMGAGPWLVWDLIGEPRATLAWEVDRAAIQVADYNIPGIHHRGDITEDSPKETAKKIAELDPEAGCIIIFLAAPPCQDFSRVGDREGHAGNRGYLFNFTADFIDELRPLLAPRRFGVLVENVEMTPADAAAATKRLGFEPVFADAADFGWIGRPRLWWTSIDWEEVTTDVQQRWLLDSGQFAPWHYQREAMLADDQGKLV